MSTCISRHGEFSEHSLDDSHTCTLCHVLDEEALRAELERLRAELARYAERLDLHAWDKLEAERDQLREQVAQYAPIAVPILADIQARKERAARMAAHTHYCWTCSDGTAPGDGCHNCRNTGMDQTPCVGCPGPQPAAEPSGEAGHG